MEARPKRLSQEIKDDNIGSIKTFVGVGFNRKGKVQRVSVYMNISSDKSMQQTLKLIAVSDSEEHVVALYALLKIEILE